MYAIFNADHTFRQYTPVKPDAKPGHVFEVATSGTPDYDPSTHNLIQVDPEIIGEYAYIRWEVVPKDQYQIWDEILAAGWTDDVTSIKLKTTVEARNTLMAHLVLLNHLINIGQITGEVVDSIWDYTDVEHQMTVNDLIGLLTRYGIGWSILFKNYAP